MYILSTSLLRIKNARVDEQGHAILSTRSTGIKWAVISAVSILAVAILAALMVAGIVFGAIHLAVVGGPIGIAKIISGIGAGIFAGLVAAAVVECIKNAHHHLKAPHAG